MAAHGGTTIYREPTMRKLVLSLFLALSPAAAFAGQAANPVELFAYGKHIGVQNGPLYVLSLSGAYPVASLPATCTDGQVVWVTNGRTAVEAAGAGTGVAARCLSNAWLSLADGTAVKS